jgi:hypothetical protein
MCTVARFHQIAADLASLAPHLGLSSWDALTGSDLLRAAQHLGLKANLARTSVERLALTQLPAPVLMRTPEQSLRVVILAHCDVHCELFQEVTSDPGASPVHPTIEHAEVFATQWTGELILISSRAWKAGMFAKFNFPLVHSGADQIPQAVGRSVANFLQGSALRVGFAVVLPGCDGQGAGAQGHHARCAGCWPGHRRHLQDHHQRHLSPAHPLMMMPNSATVTVEVSIAYLDLGFVNTARQIAEVKLETFRCAKYVSLQARVNIVTADAVTDEKNGSYYPAALPLAAMHKRIDGKRVNLSPGMNITPEIKTGQRRIIEFLLSSAQRVDSESLRSDRKHEKRKNAHDRIGGVTSL